VVQVNPRGAVDVERPLLRVAQWVAGQELGFDDETVEGAGQRSLPGAPGEPSISVSAIWR
jgi:hypothetical protein